MTATPAGVPANGSVVPLWAGVPPGSQTWTWREHESLVRGERLVRNVAVPSLEVFAPRKANGTAVIVAPGGAYHFLAIDHEGRDLARWLADRGVAAFLLRYRLVHTPEDEAELVRFQRGLDQRIRTTPWGEGRAAVFGDEAERVKALAGEDGRQTVALLRAHAGQWGIDPSRIGFVGFSAGASVAIEAALAADPSNRPSFVAAIYGAGSDDLIVPEGGAPAMFLVHAVDDPAVPVSESVSVWQAWHAAGLPAELHLFQTGGHGFGVKQLGAGTDAWIPLFETWLHGLGMLNPLSRPHAPEASR